MTTEQRLDRVETEFATIRQLLISAATYAESANRRIDELGTKQDRTQIMLDELGTKQDRTQIMLDELGTKQDRTQTQLDQLSSRVDEFIFHTQRLFNKAGSEIEETKARTERLEALMLKLDRNYEEQKSQFQEYQLTTNAALERIDRVLDYLLRQSGN
ncbi:6-aminohexanoate hydrolase [Aphanizomenon sp. UHCC 0183]|uniref:6-aminohexanoate hydrolase n=1 Tax=Aphanizomenon sp. UHCC 0183 TaxID=2590028 RepID=UPI0014476253|nr:6-aminohexanoate hydrolase [Aphanizomenon sp. UHCC 0183]MTJ33021.1 6-aminohexanoate hydrolase [Aphanizomenon sp. UHCC 0183]QSV74025.1 MAG: 6-aminohexanoate hydrolase [Aphanizomenon flos-aquae KM1D3_PB]